VILTAMPLDDISVVSTWCGLDSPRRARSARAVDPHRMWGYRPD
jgi:hypothetical protein